MSFFNEILLLFFKEIRLEIRSLFSFSGVLIYIFSIIFICYISISINNGYLNPIIWNSLFWIILLFISLYSISRKFSYENESRLLYYYSLVRPESMIFSKIFYRQQNQFAFFIEKPQNDKNLYPWLRRDPISKRIVFDKAWGQKRYR